MGTEQITRTHVPPPRADGFAARVSARLAEMRVDSAKTFGTGMDLALRDQNKINREFMNMEFPLTGGGRRGTMVKDNRKFDSAAHMGGRAAGDRASISVNPGKGLKGTKSLLG
jgi:hypothetical protein